MFAGDDLGMLKILIALLLLAACWFLWWASTGFPAQIEVCEIATGGAKECAQHNFFFGSIWKIVTVLDRYGALITAVATALLAYITYQLVVGGEQTTRQVNRAYLACGGDFDNKTGLFILDLENNGKTPASILDFDVQTVPPNQVDMQKPPEMNRGHHWKDTMPPRQRKGVKTTVKTAANLQFVYGCVWYRDVWGEPHRTRFILSANNPGTLPNVTGVHPDYTEAT